MDCLCPSEECFDDEGLKGFNSVLFSSKVRMWSYDHNTCKRPPQRYHQNVIKTHPQFHAKKSIESYVFFFFFNNCHFKTPWITIKSEM